MLATQSLNTGAVFAMSFCRWVVCLFVGGGGGVSGWVGGGGGSSRWEGGAGVGVVGSSGGRGRRPRHEILHVGRLFRGWTAHAVGYVGGE